MIPFHRAPRRSLPALLLALLALATPYAALAQAVQGRVVDDATQQPIAGAQVLLEDAQGEAGAAISQADGSFHVTAPAAGEYRLTVDQEGYDLMASTLRLVDGQVLRMDVRLVAATQPGVILPVAGDADREADVPPAAGRGITGRVAEAGTRRPVAGVTVALLNERGQEVRSAVTDAEGGFHLAVAAPGRFQLRAQRVGYERSVSQPLTVAPSDVVRVELLVSTEAVVLAPLTVVASSRDVSRSGRLASFEHRRENNPWGRFLGPDDIARIRPFRASDALQQVPFVQISGTGPVRQAHLRGRFGDRCMPTIYVDGHVIPPPASRFDSPDRAEPQLTPYARSFPVNTDASASGAGVGLDELVSGADIVAVEVYEKPFEAPAEFSPSGVQINCGVVVIWTRRPGPDNG